MVSRKWFLFIEIEKQKVNYKICDKSVQNNVKFKKINLFIYTLSTSLRQRIIVWDSFCSANNIHLVPPKPGLNSRTRVFKTEVPGASCVVWATLDLSDLLIIKEPVENCADTPAKMQLEVMNDWMKGSINKKWPTVFHTEPY